MDKAKNKIYNLLRWSEKWTKTDMVYLAKGGFWLTMGNFAFSISGFLLAIVFANFLPQETYGVYKYVLSIAGILAIPTLSGLNTAINRSVAQGYEGSFIPALKTKIKWGFLGGLASLLLAGYYFYNNDTTLTMSFLIIGIFIPFMDPLGLYGAFLVGRKDFKLSTKYSVITQIITVAIMIATVFLTNNIFLIIFAYFISSTILRFIFLILTRKKFIFNKKIDPQTISYGKHLSLISSLGAVIGHLDKIILWHFLGAVPLAIYCFAMAPVVQFRSLLKMITPLAIPKISNTTPEILKKTLFSKMFKMLIVIIIAITFYILLAPYLYEIFFPQYLESVKYSQLFVLILLFFPSKLMGLSITLHAKKKALYTIGTVPSIINLIFMLVLIPLYGITGAILSKLLTSIFTFFISLYFFKKI